MKITALRRTLILLDLVLLLGVGGSVWQAWKTKTSVENWKKSWVGGLTRELRAVKSVSGPRIKRRSYTELVTRAGNLFANRLEKKEEPKVEGPKPVPVDKTPLMDKVEVVSIKAGWDGYAYLKRKGQKDVPPGEQRFFGVNDALPFVEGAYIKEIRRRSVVCDVNGKEEILVLKQGLSSKGGKTKGGPGKPSGGKVRPLADFASGITVQPGSTVVTISRPAIEGIRVAGAEQVLKGHSFDTVRLKDGAAVRATEVPQNGALYRGGLRTGDTIVSINGRRVKSKAEIVSYVKSNPDLPRYTVVFIRNGKRQTRTVTPRR